MNPVLQALEVLRLLRRLRLLQSLLLQMRWLWLCKRNGRLLLLLIRWMCLCDQHRLLLQPDRIVRRLLYYYLLGLLLFWGQRDRGECLEELSSGERRGWNGLLGWLWLNVLARIHLVFLGSGKGVLRRLLLMLDLLLFDCGKHRAEHDGAW